jgi:hypothetical protein
MLQPALRRIQRSACPSLLVPLVLLVLGSWNGAARGEDKPPLSVGGYRLSGSASVGYRFVDIDHGSEDLYREVVNLDDGLRLFNFTLRGDRTDEATKLLDRFHLEATDIGDPYPRINLHLAKDAVYKFDMTLRSSDYFVRRTEDAFSDNHRFDLERRFGDISLTLFPADNLKVHLFYRRQERDGTGTVPRMIDNNVFVLSTAPDETTNEVGVAADFSTRSLSVRLEQSYRHFDGDGLVSLPSPGLRGLRTDAPFTDMRLDAFREQRDQTVETWTTRLQLRATLTPQWEVTQGYVFAHVNGTAQLHATEGGVGRAGTSGPNEDFTAVLTGSGDTRSDVHVVEVGTSYAVLPSLIGHLDYRFHVVDQEGEGLLETQRSGFLTGLTLVRDTGSQAITTYAHTLTTSAEWLPLPNLTLRLGYRFQLRDVNVDQVANGVPVVDDPLAAAPRLDRTTHSQGVIFDAAWRYRTLLQASAKFVGDYFDNPYTRISPTSDNRARVQVRVTPLKWLAVSETFAITDLDNPDTGTFTQSTSWTTGIFLQPIEQLTLDGSLTYSDLNHQNQTFIPINAVRTPVEFTNDSEAVSYTLSGTLTDLIPNTGLKAYATWTRVYGEGESSYFFGGGEAWYHWKKPDLRFALRYERPYVIEREPPHDEFFAHLVTLMVTKDF